MAILFVRTALSALSHTVPSSSSTVGALGLLRPGDCSLPALQLLNHPGLWTAPFPATSPTPSAQALRHKHYSKNYAFNLLRETDTNLVQRMLKKAAIMESMVEPVIKYRDLLNPEQVTMALTKVQHLARSKQHRERRFPRVGSLNGAFDEQGLKEGLMQHLGNRFAAVMKDCTNEQLALGLWSLGMAKLHHGAVLQAASQLVPDRLATFDGKQLATVAWALAAVGHDDMDLMASIANRVALARATVPPPTEEETLANTVEEYRKTVPANCRTPNASTPAHVPDKLAPVEDAVQELDHRSICKLAWAFARTGVKHQGALQALSKAATTLVADQLRAHDPDSGPLQPRRTYWYRTIAGWTPFNELRKPRPPSKYLKNNDPRTSVRDFEVDSLASVVLSFGRLQHKDDDFMRAVAFHVATSLDIPAKAPPQPLLLTVPSGQVVQVADEADLGTRGPPLKQWVPPPPSASLNGVLSLLLGCSLLGHKDPALLSAALAKAQLSAFTPAQLLLATQAVVSAGAVYPNAALMRLMRALTPQVNELQEGDVQRLHKLFRRAKWPKEEMLQMSH